MGRGLQRLVLYLWIIPVFAVGRAVEQEENDASVGGLVPEIGTSKLNYIRIGLTSTSQLPASLCKPEKFVDFSFISQSENSEILGDENQGTREVSIFYLCTQICDANGCPWRHHGTSMTLNFNSLNKLNAGDLLNKAEESFVVKKKPINAQNMVDVTVRNRRSSQTADMQEKVTPTLEVSGMSFAYASDKKRVEYDYDGSPRILENMPVTIQLYGKLHKTTLFKLTKFQKCDDPHNHEKVVSMSVDDSGTVGTVVVTMPRLGELNEVFLCLKSPTMPHFIRQGELGPEGESLKPWLVIKLYKSMLPLWLHLSLLVLLLALSGLFSGLNLGLMSLNKTDLKIIINTGTPAERQHAAAIAPVRNHGNFLLCCLLFSNVLVNASLTILVDDLTSGLVAIMMSTLAIVIFGEIVPQAICSRHALAVGAKTIYITKFFMFITSPLALPLSKVLDKILGEEIGSVYTRERLKELLKVTKDYHGLATEEVGIISGALDMKSKTVKDIMVRLENAFMLPIDTVLDFDTMAEVEYHGYSRIPVFDNVNGPADRKNIVGLLNIKQLTLLDANDNIPLKTVVEYYQNKLFFVFENTRLDFMLKAFREGTHGHMSFVQRINDEGPGDPYYETIGLLTLEDVLEELLQAEIMDESDIGKQEARKTNAIRPKHSAPFGLKKLKPKVRVELPAPLALATVQFLSTSVEPFSQSILSLSILKRLVSNCAHYIKLPRHRGNIPDIILYETGKPTEYFIMILEGRVEVTVGKEKLTYESGAFTTFGKDFLISTLAAEKGAGASATSPITAEKPESKPKKLVFIPDYTVRVITDLHYLMLKYSAYKAAILATGIERTNADPTQAHSKNWQDEIDKMLEKISAYDDDASSETSRRPRLSRDESFRATNIILSENEGISRKISCSVIGEVGHELEDHQDVVKANNWTTIDVIHSSPGIDEKIAEHKLDEETTKLLVVG